jgi:hypothetical protein
MKKRWRIVGIVAAVMVLGLVTAGLVLAQDPAGDSDGPFDFHGRFREIVSGLLGVSVEEFNTAVEQARNQTLDEAVTEGWLTQDQADRMRERMELAPGAEPWGMGMGKGFRGHGRPMHGWGTSFFSVAAEQLGMSQSDLMAALREGKTIADVAAEQGVDAQSLVDAYLAQLTEKLNEAVEEGRLTQKQADWMLEQAEGQATEQLSQTWEDCGPHGFPGFRGTERSPRFSDLDES